jgi:hypothetical protein
MKHQLDDPDALARVRWHAEDTLDPEARLGTQAALLSWMRALEQEELRAAFERRAA